MTYADAFHKIKAKLANVDTSSFEENFGIQVTIKDEDAAGTFYVAYIGGEFFVEPYDYRDNVAAIDITVDNFVKLVTGRIKAEKALEDGRIDCFGDKTAVAKLGGIVKAAKKAAPKKAEPAVKKETGPKKVSAKKPVEKKTPAKKTGKTTANK